MRTSAAMLIIFAVLSGGAMAADVGFNSDAYLAANPDVRAAGYTAYQHINMIDGPELAARLAATTALVNKANSAGEVRVMFCGDCNGFMNGASTIQDANAWYLSLPTGKTTINAMVADGWRVQTAFAPVTKQFYIIFQR